MLDEVVAKWAPLLAQIVVDADDLVRRRPVQAVFSGFLLEYKRRLFWASAGHVFTSSMLEIQKNKNLANVRYLFVDGQPGYVDHKARAMPFVIDDCRYFAIDRDCVDGSRDSGMDLSLMEIPQYLTENIRNNRGSKVIRLEDCAKAVKADHVVSGLYLVGIPGERVMRTKTDLSLQTHFLPIEPLRSAPSGLPGLRCSRYGKLLAMGEGEPLKRIEGMSGGPIVAVEMRSNMEWGIRLEGIQSSWNCDSRLIRYTSIEEVVKYIHREERRAKRARRTVSPAAAVKPSVAVQKNKLTKLHSRPI